MSQPTISDEDIFTALETTIDYLAKNIPIEKYRLFAPKELEADLLTRFSEKEDTAKKPLTLFLNAVTGIC